MTQDKTWFGWKKWTLLVLLWVGLMAPQVVSAQVAPMGTPRIDLQAVEKAFWESKGSHPKDVNGWMQRFEDEVNAIYFGTLRRLYPQADPATLMPRPVRVEAQRQNGMLVLYGYIDQNGRHGFQTGQDILLFAFEQNRAYVHQQRQFAYSLRDGDGYYWREPSYVYTIPAQEFAFMTGFFLYPAVWFAPYWRGSFVWWGTRYWQAGPFYTRFQMYYGLYPRYYSAFRRTYYNRYRPWGWRRGVFYRRGKAGRYYYRPGYMRTYRGGWRRGYYRGYRRGFRRGLQRQRRYRNQRRTYQRRQRSGRVNRGNRGGGRRGGRGGGGRGGRRR